MILPSFVLAITFEPQETIGNFTAGQSVVVDPGTIGSYIRAIYVYAVGIVGILATVVMMIGGIIYITSGGRSSSIEDAKLWIKASLTGLFLILFSYSILYLINPALTELRPLDIPTSKNLRNPEIVKTLTQTSVIGGTSACKGYSVENVIDYSKVTDGKAVSSSCSTYNPDFYSVGFDGDVLKSIAMRESSCNPTAKSPAGACGLMQLKVGTALMYNSNAKDCQWLIDHPKESIQIAAQYLQDPVSGGGRYTGNLYNLLAGYNGGYGTGVNSEGKLPPLAESNDCPRSMAYECCINPGGLDETQDYVLNVVQYYNGLK